ncbi:hypothetical protein PIIN_10477 [Serendipita indica DSM 11827]|uniref:Uncharacterized protein n=1 Tax=Serendipita indica (strain DSM 11827) TaxID=1109443 RepID=G4TYU1_SERID|nr:hypothetical protein PIIN_10477 [Serendipita indica DSM 11827]
MPHFTDKNQTWHCPVCPPTSEPDFVKPHPTREAGCSALLCILGDDGYTVDSIWCEFGIEECTWKPTHTFDGTTLIKEFYAAAQAEELDLTYEVSADKVILLNEAREFVGTWVTSHA